MLLVSPGYQLLADGRLTPVNGGCLSVSGGRLTSDGSILWDHEQLRVETPATFSAKNQPDLR